MWQEKKRDGSGTVLRKNSHSKARGDVDEEGVKWRGSTFGKFLKNFLAKGGSPERQGALPEKVLELKKGEEFWDPDLETRSLAILLRGRSSLITRPRVMGWTFCNGIWYASDEENEHPLAWKLGHEDDGMAWQFEMQIFLLVIEGLEVQWWSKLKHPVSEEGMHLL
ncbi:hypothetical protein VNO77_26787 [Canavalia gladiata]|uniref:Uncharacterized protein n=1 Tax=Canavalia gladiata TaxID=3824 RepID=A0AAN9KWM5_CANGL